MDSAVFFPLNILNRNNGTSDTSRVSTSKGGINQHAGNLSSHTRREHILLTAMRKEKKSRTTKFDS